MASTSRGVIVGDQLTGGGVRAILPGSQLRDWDQVAR
jgi:hypothetical protein